MKKIKKIFKSILISTLLILLGFVAATADYSLLTKSTGESLTAENWNQLVNNVKGIVTDTNNNVGIGTDTPSEKLDVVGDIKIEYEPGKTITISELMKNINKEGYVFWTRNSTDGGHSWYGSGTNFRNCEVIEYFQAGETIQNTIVTSILINNLGNSRNLWVNSPNHSKFIRDFDASAYPTDSIYYGSWATLIYGPSILERCVID